MPAANFIRLMADHGNTWEEYERAKWGVRVSRYHNYFDGSIERAWTKILSRPDASLRWRSLKAQGWRETLRSAHCHRTREVKKNPVRGEWWIDDSGTALYADGDVGDMGHEAYVIDSLTRRLLSAMDIDSEGGNIDDKHHKKLITERMREDGFDGTIEEFVEKAAEQCWKDPDQRRAAIEVVYNIGQMDARMYGMRYDGWKRVQGHNIETWSLRPHDLKTITDGLYDAAGGDEIADDEEFNIYVFNMKMWYQDVPWSVLKDDDPGKLRIYGTKDNPMRKHYDFTKGFPVITYAAAHKWEPLAKAQGVSEVARSSRGFMRAYEKVGVWAALDPWWKARRHAFVARHMAQVKQNGEKLWKADKSGNLRPSRRCLALIMWAYMPPRKP